MTEEQQQKMEELARKILTFSRDTLLVNLRFMDTALSRLTYQAIEEDEIATNGSILFFSPRRILTSYQLEKESVVRNYLHIILHCVFRHMYLGQNLEREYWDLACDIAVENMIAELHLPAAVSKREKQQCTYLFLLKKKLKKMTAERIYHFLRKGSFEKKEIANIRAVFYADNHERWYVPAGSGQNGSGESEGEESEQKRDLRMPDMGRESDWERISKQIQTDLETFSKRIGNAAGSLIQNLEEVNREKYDYTSFLKKFAVSCEAMKVNEDEFDYIFYNYGMELFGNMPLIEPLEYKEIKQIREFVIAIDTSGSVMGQEVQNFIQKTYNILKTTESFANKINLHLIQCDAEIQEDVKITCQEDLDRYLKEMKLHGFGGTDFRPVFEYVDSLIQQKEFTNLKGLLYFTDGYGVFPKKKPEYQTAFLFVKDDSIPEVPSWAMKLVLDEEELEDHEQ